MEVEVKDTPALRVVAMRHTGPYPEIGHVFQRLFPWGGQNRVPIQGALAIYHDNPDIVPAAQLRSDACLIVPPSYAISDPAVQVVDIPAQRSAVATYVGPYSGLPEAWGELMHKWFPASREKPGPGTAYELYVNDCMDTPEKLITELHMPVGG